MSFTGLLIHTCTLQPRTRSGTDATGAAVEVDGTPVTGVACRLQSLRGDEGLRDERVTATHRLFLDASQPIDEIAQVQNVVDRAGNTLLVVGDVAYAEPLSDSNALHHHEVLVEEVK